MKNRIKNLREENNLTQSDVAKKIKVSRPTYIQIERGKKDLEIGQVEKLADLFNVDFCEIIGKTSKKKYTVTIPKKKKINNSKQEIRINIPQKNLEKFEEVLLYILGKVGSRPNVGETVIYKLLYFIDFDYYEKYEEQLMGAKYIKNHFGPTPVAFKTITDAMIISGDIEKVKSKYFQHEQKKYLPLRQANIKILNAQEIQHIDEVLDRLAWKSAKELSDYSHEDTPWQVHEMNEEIDYETVFYRGEDHSVRNYDDEL